MLKLKEQQQTKKDKKYAKLTIRWCQAQLFVKVDAADVHAVVIHS